jgi:hypothetical protein
MPRLRARVDTRFRTQEGQRSTVRKSLILGQAQAEMNHAIAGAPANDKFAFAACKSGPVLPPLGQSFGKRSVLFDTAESGFFFVRLAEC